MRKCVSILLACVFLWLAMPLSALAEALNPPPTGRELSAALAVTGLTEDAPGYHSGMAPDYSMTALQLTGWINDFQKNQLNYILDSFENYDVALYDIRENHAQAYETLQTTCSGGIAMLYSEYSMAKEWQDEVNYYAERLPILAGEIYNTAEALRDTESLSERDQAIHAFEMRAKWQELTQLMKDAVDRTTNWDRLYTHLPKESWEDLSGENSDTLSLKAVTMDMSGNQYRLSVTDASGYSAVSRAASLTVRQVPRTGDDAPLGWFVVGAAVGLLGIGIISVKRKKACRADRSIE